MTIWTVLVYLFVLLLTLAAIVGGLVVLRRLEAQKRLREELLRLEGARPPNDEADDEGAR